MPLSILFLLFFEINTINIEWTTPKEHDFDILRHNVPARTDFRFVNKSDVPLVIDAVRTTCGCTAADYPEAPVMPNETATISIEYDSHKVGFFSKKVRVFFAGHRKPEVLTISGEVE